MGNVSVELGVAAAIASNAVLINPRSALVAETSKQMVLAPTAGATVSQLATGHCHEQPLRALNDFEVTNDEVARESDRAERTKFFVVLIHELDADFGDVHDASPWALKARVEVIGN